MTIESTLMERAGAKCELCSATNDLATFDVLPNAGKSLDTCALICATCLGRMTDAASADAKHWYCLNESMWSEHPAVKVLVYRVLKSLGSDPWALDLLTQLYLDDETQQWADAGLSAGDDDDGDAKSTVDSNGTPLLEGDTVTLIKDLEVKGANFTAKRGTTVKGINLTDDPRYVEGRVNGIRIVLVAAYLKKA